MTFSLAHLEVLNHTIFKPSQFRGKLSSKLPISELQIIKNKLQTSFIQQQLNHIHFASNVLSVKLYQISDT